MKRFPWLLCSILALIAFAAGCGDGDSDSDPTTPPATDVSKFVGLWHMSLKSDASDPGFDWRFNADNTVALYNTGSKTPKGTGTCIISGQTSAGNWQASGDNKGRFTSTLTGDNSLDFNFIEDKYSPPKTFYYTGTRLEGPPAGSSSTPPPATGDMLDATLVSWDEPAGNVGAWDVTAKITSASMTHETYTIIRDPMNNWPVVQLPGWSKPSIGNWWVIAKCSDGNWHGATIDWLGVTARSTAARKWDGHDDIHGCLSDWRPRAGETAYAMQSTHARAGVIDNNRQRTNIYQITMP